LKLVAFFSLFNHLNAELNSICHLLALLGAHHILHVSRVRVNVMTLILIRRQVLVLKLHELQIFPRFNTCLLIGQCVTVFIL